MDKKVKQFGGVFEGNLYMVEIEIMLHPLSKKMLYSHYGNGIIVLGHKDTIFDAISNLPRNTKSREKGDYCAPVVFSLYEPIARSVRNNPRAVADRIYRIHKNLMCWYAAASVNARGKGHAREAISEFLAIHGVTEDDFSMDTAYKTFQRFGWNFQKKNSGFSIQPKPETVAELHRKRKANAKNVKRYNPLKCSQSELVTELAISKFINQYTILCSRMPRVLPTHARIYIYKLCGGLSIRDTAKKMGTSPGKIQYACTSMHNRLQRNPALHQLLQEVLPQQ